MKKAKMLFLVFLTKTGLKREKFLILIQNPSFLHRNQPVYARPTKWMLLRSSELLAHWGPIVYSTSLLWCCCCIIIAMHRKATSAFLATNKSLLLVITPNNINEEKQKTSMFDLYKKKNNQITDNAKSTWRAAWSFNGTVRNEPWWCESLCRKSKKEESDSSLLSSPSELLTVNF